MSELQNLIQEQSRLISRLKLAVHEAFENRSDSPAYREAWFFACKEFHEGYSRLFFPGGMAGWKEFIDAGPNGIEVAIVFLEADPRFFRSGYLKEIIWSCLKRNELSAKQVERLEDVAIRYVGMKFPSREFWYMVRFVRARGSAGFWDYVLELASDPSLLSSAKATWLLAARKNIPIKNWVRAQLLRASYQNNFLPDYRFPL